MQIMSKWNQKQTNFSTNYSKYEVGNYWKIVCLVTVFIDHFRSYGDVLSMFNYVIVLKHNTFLRQK